MRMSETSILQISSEPEDITDITHSPPTPRRAASGGITGLTRARILAPQVPLRILISRQTYVQGVIRLRVMDCQDFITIK